MKATVDLIERALGHKLTDTARTNANQILLALDSFGEQFGLDKPHRLAQYLPQLTHESGEFKYDKEVWGPTPAQKRYDTRTNLGNSPEQDGDGFLFRGRAGIQVTGKSNYAQFRDWCRANIRAEAPDFVAEPNKVLTDPWEGLAPIWYWATRKLNKLADAGNNEMIRRKINGGTNGLEECLALYTRFSLVMLGFPIGGLKDFQASAKREGLYSGDVDGLDGPKTRSALHLALAKLTDAKVTAAPVTEEVREVIAVTPPALDKPIMQTAGMWERLTQIGGISSIAALSAFFQEWRVVLVICGFLLVGSIVGIILHKRIIDAVKSVKESLQS
jgi:putative chitinase